MQTCNTLFLLWSLVFNIDVYAVYAVSQRYCMHFTGFKFMLALNQSGHYHNRQNYLFNTKSFSDSGLFRFCLKKYENRILAILWKSCFIIHGNNKKVLSFFFCSTINRNFGNTNINMFPSVSILYIYNVFQHTLQV